MDIWILASSLPDKSERKDSDEQRKVQETNVERSWCFVSRVRVFLSAVAPFPSSRGNFERSRGTISGGFGERRFLRLARMGRHAGKQSFGGKFWRNKFFTAWPIPARKPRLRHGERPRRRESITWGTVARRAKFNYVRKTGWSGRRRKRNGRAPALCRHNHPWYLFFLRFTVLSRCYLDRPNYERHCHLSEKNSS